MGAFPVTLNGVVMWGAGVRWLNVADAPQCRTSNDFPHVSFDEICKTWCCTGTRGAPVHSLMDDQMIVSVNNITKARAWLIDFDDDDLKPVSDQSIIFTAKASFTPYAFNTMWNSSRKIQDWSSILVRVDTKTMKLTDWLKPAKQER